MAFLSLLLPGCSNHTSPSEENISISGEAENLSHLSPNNATSFKTTPLEFSDSPKFPASSGNTSGERASIIQSPLEENLEKSITNTVPNSEFENNSKSENDLENNSEDDSEEPSLPASSRELLATYSSKVYTKTADRQKNLRIVCERLTGTILEPNQEFSYNETCGPYNKENGFGKATIFVGNGIEKQDYGGGVCQLSSTLYNAVKDLNVEITERHLHSKKVYYVPDGQDATVSYGNLDFKFKNNNAYSLYFEATSNAEQVNVYVYKA